MPELPEVQTIADDLNRKIVGKRVVGFWTDWPKSVRTPGVASLRKNIKNLKVEKVQRLGKNVLVYLSADHLLVVHQKMTGHLMVGKWLVKKKKTGWEVKSLPKGPFGEKVNQYIHNIFYLNDGRMLALSDLRKFARIDFGKREDVLALPSLRNLGPDALDPELSLAEFKKIIKTKKKPIKTALMDLSVVAGIGNIYADEILYRAGVHPASPGNTLRENELKKIFLNMKKILKEAVKLRGTSVGDYRDTAGRRGKYGNKLLVYRRAGLPCLRCGAPIQKIVLSQRSAHFCPHCQGP